MKKLFIIFCFLPLAASAQTTKQKVLYMNVVRTNGSITARLESGEDYLGPLYNLETKRITINGSSRTLNTIKEIRFEIREEEVADGIEDIVEGEGDSPSPLYDLSGRRVEEGCRLHGVYIRDGKKIIKK